MTHCRISTCFVSHLFRLEGKVKDSNPQFCDKFSFAHEISLLFGYKNNKTSLFWCFMAENGQKTVR